ncbi:MAG: methyltransferase domain-containing protein [Pseudomonadota bacterium]
MHLDVVELRSFYTSTQLGRFAQRAVRERLRLLWPNVRGQSLVGFGYAAPFMRPFLTDAQRTLCLMPAQQGVCAWPSEGPNLSALVEETLWPLPGGFADRIIVAHGLETCERPAALLSEIWRVLAPGGRVTFIVPNRAGMWARRDGSPLSFGRPYSIGQLDAALTDQRFTPLRHTAALYGPPSHKRFWLRSAPTIESIGQRLDARRLAGLLIVEAEKLVYITPQSGSRVSARDPIRVLAGLGAPQPKPAGRTTPDPS